MNNSSLNNGILTYINEAAWGDLKQLLIDVGINRETIRFSNVAELKNIKDGVAHASDEQWRNFTNGRFTGIDMTDYEYDFPSPNEVGNFPL